MRKWKYISGYPDAVLSKVRALIERDKLGALLEHRYPDRHDVQSDRALYDYVMALKNRHLRSSRPLSRVAYDDSLDRAHRALGIHARVRRKQGHKTKAKRELRVASVFKQGPPEFLRAIVVHELAHLREFDHNKAFYRLCLHMEPDYHQLEFDMRLWLTWLDTRRHQDGRDDT